MEKNTLYLVATPIGNLSDISQRALQVLGECDFIAAEDTRRTVQLLNHFNIKKPMVSYFEHNKRERGEYIINRIKNGESCALVTDAGTPAISDPGEDLVVLCGENSINTVPIPGPCAFVQALIVSGLPTGRFSFEGFLSVNKPQRRKHLESIKDMPHTLIFYEAPHKLITTLNDLYTVFGNRKIALVKEITKIHEKVTKCTLSESVKLFESSAPKGEYVLVVEGKKEETPSPEEISKDMIISVYRRHFSILCDKKAAMKAAAKELSVSKRDVYSAVTDEEDRE